jgi:large subunit ribosomal protein L19
VLVERHSKVRRAQLYFLRARRGKRARLKQRFS